VSDSYRFQPPLRAGIIFHLAAILLLALSGAGSLWLASLAESGKNFTAYILPAALSVVGAPFLAYRLRSLQSGRYILERDAIHLTWGLRAETIPMYRVLWVRAQESLGRRLPVPLLRWPGCVLGWRNLTEDIQIEFMAARATRLVIIATPEHWYAISPEDPLAFLQAYRRLSELGSLAPAQAASQRPQVLLARSWYDAPARAMALGEIGLAVLLFLVTALAVSNRTTIPLRLAADGSPSEMTPAVRLFLLPVINSIFTVADLIAGFFFYRQKENQPLAYLTWGAGLLSAGLFLGAVVFLATAR
jgi:hypothetical protein